MLIDSNRYLNLKLPIFASFVGGSTVVFDPTSVTGNIGWWDVATGGLNASNVIAQTGEAIATIQDKSTNGFHVTNATSTQQPIKLLPNGKAIAQFDGVDDWLSTTNTGLINQISGTSEPYTAVTAFARGSGTALRAVWGFGRSNSNQPFCAFDWTGTAYRNVRRSDSSVVLNASGGTLDTLPHISTVTYSGLTAVLRIDGVQVGVASNAGSIMTVNRFAIGAIPFLTVSSYNNGTFAGMALYNRVLTSTEITTLESYFTSRYL